MFMYIFKMYIRMQQRHSVTFSASYYWDNFFVYLSVKQPVLLVRNMITEEVVIQLFLYTVPFALVYKVNLRQ